MKSDFEQIENELKVKIEQSTAKIEEYSAKIEELTVTLKTSEEDYM